MKKLQLLIFAILLTVPLFAQDTTSVSTKEAYLYAEIIGTSKLLSNKVTVSIDFGQNTKFMEDTRLRDDAGNVIVFNSMVDAMNWMGAEGWEFLQAYVVTIGQSNVYHWLLKLNLNKLSPEQLEKVTGKFKTKKTKSQ